MKNKIVVILIVLSVVDTASAQSARDIDDVQQVKVEAATAPLRATGGPTSLLPKPRSVSEPVASKPKLVAAR
jgi:hypothetical protein